MSAQYYIVTCNVPVMYLEASVWVISDNTPKPFIIV